MLPSCGWQRGRAQVATCPLFIGGEDVSLGPWSSLVTLWVTGRGGLGPTGVGALCSTAVSAWASRPAFLRTFDPHSPKTRTRLPSKEAKPDRALGWETRAQSPFLPNCGPSGALGVVPVHF